MLGDKAYREIYRIATAIESIAGSRGSDWTRTEDVLRKLTERLHALRSPDAFVPRDDPDEREIYFRLALHALLVNDERGTVFRPLEIAEQASAAADAAIALKQKENADRAAAIVAADKAGFAEVQDAQRRADAVKAKRIAAAQKAAETRKRNALKRAKTAQEVATIGRSMLRRRDGKGKGGTVYPSWVSEAKMTFGKRGPKPRA